MDSSLNTFFFNLKAGPVFRPSPTPPLAPIIQPTLEAVGRQIQKAADPIKLDDDWLITPEEIKSHSLLQQPQAKQLRDEFVTLAELPRGHDLTRNILRIAVNFAGSGSITGDKRYEGMQPSRNFAIWRWLIQDLSDKFEPNFLKNLDSGLQKLLAHSKILERRNVEKAADETLYEDALALTKQVQALKPGEAEVFVGGYMNDGSDESVGHLQIYEIQRREEGSFDIHLYTSTNFQLADLLLIEKRRLKPIVRYEKIPEEVLLFNRDGIVRPGFIAALNELTAGAKKNLNRVVNDDDTLQVFDFLSPYFVNSSFQECGLVTGQRGGTCVPSVTKVWMRTHAKDLHLYKQMQFQCQMKLLTACHLSLSDLLDQDSPEAHTARKVLTHMSRRLLRYVEKMLKGNLIDQQMALMARATAHDSLRRVAEGEAIVEKERSVSAVDSDLSTLRVDQQRAKRQALPHPVAALTEIPAIKPAALVDFSIRLGNSPDTYMKALLKTEKACQAIEEKMVGVAPELQLIHEHSYALQIEQFVDQLPLPNMKESVESLSKVDCFEAPFWETFTLEELKTAQKGLYTLLHKAYFPKKYYDCELLPRRMATILPLQAIFHYLSLKIDAKSPSGVEEGRLENYPIFFDKQIVKIPGLHFLDRAEFERVRETVHYFHSFNGLKFAHKDPLFNSEGSSEVDQKGIKDWPANSRYWMALYNSDPTLKKSVDSEAEEMFPTKSQRTIEREYQAQLKLWQEESYRSYFSSPSPEPCRQENLPSLTKAYLMLGYFNSADQNLLSKHGFEHADMLRHMTFVCRRTLSGALSKKIRTKQQSCYSPQIAPILPMG